MKSKKDCVRRLNATSLLVFSLFSILSLLCWNKVMAEQPPSDKGDHVATGGDLAFMNDAAPGGAAEVAFGQMAMTKGAKSEVREFGQKMVADHSKAGKELEALADAKGVSLSSQLMPAHRELKAKLAELSGADFDRAYVLAMVTAHKKDVAAFQAVAKNATDADVKTFAANTLPTLEMHLQMIQALAAKMGVKPDKDQ
ncbi:MAG: DUF4142 domain-containing protein [Verrucomicrobiota bacterium]|nr:DUF4142 domain-containing protein [Verrucomicrobiota bacterium]